MWSAHGFVCINNEMLIIWILPVRMKKQPSIFIFQYTITSGLHASSGSTMKFG